MLKSPFWRIVPKFLFVAIALAFAVFLGDGDYKVEATGNFGASTTITSLSSSATSADADFTSFLLIGNNQLNFGQVTTSFPRDPAGSLGVNGNIHPAPTTIAGGLGDIAATLTSSVTLGLLAGPCDDGLPVAFDMMNASVDNSAPNLIAPLTVAGSGAEGVLENMRDDTGGGAPANDLPAHVEKYPSYLNTIFNGVAPTARYSGSTIVSSSSVVLEFMIYSAAQLNSAFNAPNNQQELADNDLGWYTVTVLQDPTQPAAPSSIDDFCAPLSTTTVTYGEFRSNPCLTDVGGNCPNVETDCTPGPCGSNAHINSPSTECVGGVCVVNYANVGNGTDRYHNPSTAGQNFFTAYHQSLRDTDNDGIENSFDTCPYSSTPLATYNPRGFDATDDADGDMLPRQAIGGCDDDDSSADANNLDGDTAANGGIWENSGDNCPLSPNGTNAEGEQPPTADNVRFPRGGPGDGIGDPCDAAETSCGPGDATDNDTGILTSGNGPDGLINDGCAANGAAETGCLNSVDDDGDTEVNDGCPSSAMVATGHWHSALTLNPRCITGGGTVDTDADGWCDATETALGSCSANPCPAAFTGAGCPACAGTSTPEHYTAFRPLAYTHSGAGNPTLAREPVQICNDGVDNDKDGAIDLMDGLGVTESCAPTGTSPIDVDGDGFADEVEIHIGTDALGRCERGATTAGSSDWGADLQGGGAVSTDVVELGDIGSFFAPVNRFNTSPPEVSLAVAGYNRRWDLVPGPAIAGDFWVGLPDLGALLAGGTSAPPMFGGASVFNGPTCSAHPTLND